jgi:FkbM family methyltransferase
MKQLVKAVMPSWLWSALRAGRRRFEQKSFQRRVVQHRYLGVPLRVLLADPLGAGWYDHDCDVMRDIELLRRWRLRRGSRVFDLGAHQGVIALVLAEIVGPEGKVIALEADAFNADIARENATLNGARQLEVVPAAISDSTGELVFTHEGHVGAGKESGVRVPCVTVDDLADRYGVPDILFVDVEGYECQALRGARRVLASRPDCCIEVHVGEGLERFGSVDEVVSHFPPDAYELWAAPESDDEPFVPFRRDLPFLSRRFFFVAHARAA